jgi:hypothetical protein
MSLAGNEIKTKEERAMLLLDTEQQLHLNIPDVIGASIAVLGVTGSGKSNTVAVLAEELLFAGIPMTLLDPEGELFGLKQRFPLLVVGRSEQSEVDVGPDHAAALATLSVERGLSIILDVSEHTKGEQEALLLPYLSALWEACRKVKRPYVAVVEEAHEYCPQGGKSPLKDVLTRIALRGRKRGLSLVLASQRSAKVEKDVLTQVRLLFLHRVTHPIDFQVYKDLIPLPGKEVEERVRALEAGQAMVLAHHQTQTVQIRRRHTLDPSSTPTFEAVELQKVDSTLLAELQQMFSTPNPAYLPQEERARLQARIKELEAQVAGLSKELEELRRRPTMPQEALALHLPETLEIQQATVHQMVTPGASQASHIVEATPVRTVALPSADLTPAEKQQLTLLRSRIDHLESIHQRVLQVLASQEDTRMDVSTIASWLYLQPSSIPSLQPLMKLGLIELSKGTRGRHLYASRLRKHLRDRFPRLDAEQLAQHVLAGLPGRS